MSETRQDEILRSASGAVMRGIEIVEFVCGIPIVCGIPTPLQKTQPRLHAASACHSCGWLEKSLGD